MYRNFVDFVSREVPIEPIMGGRYIEGKESKTIYFSIIRGTRTSHPTEPDSREFNIMTIRKALTAPNDLGLDKLLQQYARKLRKIQK